MLAVWEGHQATRISFCFQRKISQIINWKQSINDNNKQVIGLQTLSKNTSNPRNAPLQTVTPLRGCGTGVALLYLDVLLAVGLLV